VKVADVPEEVMDVEVNVPDLNVSLMVSDVDVKEVVDVTVSVVEADVNVNVAVTVVDVLEDVRDVKVSVIDVDVAVVVGSGSAKSTRFTVRLVPEA